MIITAKDAQLIDSIKREFHCNGATAEYLAALETRANAITEPDEYDIELLKRFGVVETVADTTPKPVATSWQIPTTVGTKPVTPVATTGNCLKCGRICPANQIDCCIDCLRARITELAPTKQPVAQQTLLEIKTANKCKECGFERAFCRCSDLLDVAF